MPRPEPDPPIAYMARTRAFYAALGYGPAYVWATFDTVPFTSLARPLNKARVALVTTAAPFKPEAGDQGPGAPYNASAKFYEVYSLPSDSMPDLRISHIAIDRDHTSATDQASYFPLAALQGAERSGRIGAVAPRVHGLPTNRSQRHTIEVDCPELLARIEADGAEAAILVANCPVCHQSASLAARSLETAGVATVVMGCALDIVEHVGVARYLFSDFPLGNGAGLPHDQVAQAETLEMALALLDDATAPRTTRHSPLAWPGPPGWKADYANPDRLSAEEIARRKADFDRAKETARGLRDGR